MPKPKELPTIRIEWEGNQLGWWRIFLDAPTGEHLAFAGEHSLSQALHNLADNFDLTATERYIWSLLECEEDDA